MISGVVLARNEESNIVDCLEALRPHVAEILLIDMESSDRTVELARPLVEKVLRHPLVANFDPVRNIAISETRYDWMWFVDADERIPIATGQLINELVRTRGCDFEALTVPFKSYFCGRWMQHCGWWPGYTMPRVPKRGHFHFVERLHGGVELQGRQVHLPPDPKLAIDHFSYRSLEHYVEKLNRYTTTEAVQMANDGVRWDLRDAFRHMIHDLWVYYERNPGYLDQEHGWILSWLSGQYRWLSYAKLFDTQVATYGNDRKPSVPTNLDEVVHVFETELATIRAKSPKLPLGIVWRSPIWDASGYADEGRTLTKALSRGARPLVLEDIRWNNHECAILKRTSHYFER